MRWLAHALGAWMAGRRMAGEMVGGRIVVIPDVHGDHDRFLDALKLAKVLDANGQWAMEKGGTVVFTGDLVDRGPKSLESYDTLASLREKAQQNGCTFKILLGNHEVMNLMGDLRYVNPAEMEKAGGRRKWQQMFAKGQYYGDLLRSFDTMAMINGTIFAHTGYNPRAGLGSFFDVKKRMDATKAKDQWNDAVWGQDGPIWNRGLLEDKDGCAQLDELLTASRAKRLIVGHTPQDKVTPYCNGKMIVGDVGMSRWLLGNQASCLELPAGNSGVYAVGPDGRFRVDQEDLVVQPDSGLRGAQRFEVITDEET